MEFKERFDSTLDERYLPKGERERLQRMLLSDLLALQQFSRGRFKGAPIEHTEDELREMVSVGSDFYLEMMCKEVHGYQPVEENLQRKILHLKQKRWSKQQEVD